MCGRFSLRHSEAAIAEAFQLQALPTIPPRYNIAPTQPVPVVLVTPEQPTHHFQWLYWGLIPSWADDPKIGVRMINARSETVAEKPSFRNAFKRRRCLIVADGFYEWQRLDGQKQPFYFQVHEGNEIFAFAGLWEYWASSTGEEITSCSILTTEANDLMRPIHDRMPVILHATDYDRWLDPTVQQASALQPLLQPYSAEAMSCYPVSTHVNNAKHEDASCIQPLQPVSNQ
jgi:putative SOS response-associated peptidase YedK